LSTFIQAYRNTENLEDWLQRLTDEINNSMGKAEFEGSGSPEGVITAEPRSFYVDTAGGAGTVLYVKQSGTGNTGWILV